VGGGGGGVGGGGGGVVVGGGGGGCGWGGGVGGVGGGGGGGWVGVWVGYFWRGGGGEWISAFDLWTQKENTERDGDASSGKALAQWRITGRGGRNSGEERESKSSSWKKTWHRSRRLERETERYWELKNFAATWIDRTETKSARRT